jgi:protein arginine kinase activator
MLLVSMQPNDPANTPPLTLSVCPDCGFSWTEIKHTGRLGCGCCYQVFQPFIDPQLPRLHRGIQHFGKIPLRSALADQQNKLRTALAQAITAEDFEQAASLRDQLNSQLPAKP